MIERGEVWQHIESGNNYIILTSIAMLKVFCWWVGMLVVYRSATDPTSIYIRFSKDFARKFTRVG